MFSGWIGQILLAYLRWKRHERLCIEGDWDFQNRASDNEQILPMVWSNKLLPSYPMVHAFCWYLQPLQNMEKLIDFNHLNISSISICHKKLKWIHTRNTFGTDFMHFTACRYHSHGQFVNDQNTPFDAIRFIFAGLRWLVPNHLVHNLCNSITYSRRWRCVLIGMV